MELDDEDPLNVSLTLYNIDYCAVGYYACFDDTVDIYEILTTIIEEPTNTEHATFTYVFVDGETNVPNTISYVVDTCAFV